MKKFAGNGIPCASRENEKWSGLTQKSGCSNRKQPSIGSECGLTTVPNSRQRRAVKVSKSTAKQRIGQLELDLDVLKPVHVSFDGEDISGNGGALLIAQVEKLTGFIRGAADRLDDHRIAALVKHNLFEQVFQRVLQIIAGAAATSDSDILRHDPALKLAAGRNPISGEALASQPTQSRLENGRSWKELYRLCQWLVDYYIECHKKPPKSIVLDFDGSAIETYGLQLQAFYRSGPYGKYMYFPLFVFDQHGSLLVAALRPGDHGEVTLSLPVLKRLVRRLREAWPKVEIFVRADGAFTDAEFYKWMDENNVKYTLGLKHNNVLLTYSKSARQEAARKFNRKFGPPLFLGKQGEKLKLETIKFVRTLPDPKERTEAQHLMNSRRVRVFSQFNYGAKTWSRERRVISRVDFDDEGVNVRYIVTNVENLAPAQVYEDIYCQRARMELWIKNIKETNCTRLSCAQFKANMFRLLLHAFAYVLLHEVRRRLAYENTSMSLTQLRLQLVFVPLQVQENRNSINVRISATYRHARTFRLLCKRFGAHSDLAA
jgi:hypothetical protein